MQTPLHPRNTAEYWREKYCIALGEKYCLILGSAVVVGMVDLNPGCAEY